MLALLRFRRIPYRLLPSLRNSISPDIERFEARPSPKVPLLPTFYLKDDSGQEQAVCDTTPLIREFEIQYEDRSVIPENTVMAFIDYLLEDYADEWLTKAMFHYRWAYEADIEKAGQMLPRWNNITASDEEIAKLSQAISQRQISRLSYVGSNAVTTQTIEESFHRFIDLLNNHFQNLPFLLGKRPAACDFAIYGQLICLALFDPTPQKIILERAPRVYAWTEVMEDLSGYEILEDDWLAAGELPETLIAILGEVGRIYVPYLLANAEAVANRQDLLEMELDGRPWQQNPFTYQAKCLHWLREKQSQLTEPQKEQLSELIRSTGIDSLFN
jgi:glutathione S-transferase